MLNILLSPLTQENRDEYPVTSDEIVEFLYFALDKFRDDKGSISKAIEYALSKPNRQSGFVLGAFSPSDRGPQMVGAVVLNTTGMSGYVPPNFLVYIAVNPYVRGKGLGKRLIQEVFRLTEGPISLHVEYDNPAKILYEKLGFTSKYAEMRWETPIHG